MLETSDITPQPGATIEWDMPEHVYHGDPAAHPSLSSTIAKSLVHETPLHAWTKHPRLNPFFEDEHKDAFDLGSTAHTVLLGKGAEIDVIDAKDWRTKAAREAKEAACAAGKTPILAADHERVEVMVEAARMQLTAIGLGDVFGRAIGREVSFFAEVQECLCRCRVDALAVEERAGRPLLVAYDYKTTARIPTDAEIPRLLANLSYDIQDAHYTATVAAATGLPCEMRFVIQEKSPPHLLTVTRLSLPWREDGQQMAQRAREVWSRCLATNTWPGLSGDIIEAEAPPWHVNKWSERKTAIVDARDRFGTDILARAFQFQAPEPNIPQIKGGTE